MHPNQKWEVNSPYGSQYDMHVMRRARTSSDLTAESFDSLHDSESGLLSALSNATMEDHLDRNAASSARFRQRRQQVEQQHQQQQNLLYPQQQQHDWGREQNF